MLEKEDNSNIALLLCSVGIYSYYYTLYYMLETNISNKEIT